MIAIIDYDAGNLTSVARAVRHLGFDCEVTNDSAAIADSDRIIFPGVGAAGSAMQSLQRLGLDRLIRTQFLEGKPILGICLGTQIVMTHSEENRTDCLGLIRGTVRAFPPDLKSESGARLKIPHMGWNRIRIRRQHPVLQRIDASAEFYFVHSYYPDPEPNELVATTDYGVSFASVIGFRNLIATQFHPEKSGKAGLILLENFCRWKIC